MLADSENPLHASALDAMLTCPGRAVVSEAVAIADVTLTESIGVVYGPLKLVLPKAIRQRKQKLRIKRKRRKWNE